MKLTYKQSHILDILEDKITKEIVAGGGAGGGKSMIGCYWLLKNCLKYPETRWLMGRAKLKTLKETTLNTFLWVCKEQGIINGEHFIINNQSNTIKFYNGSEILMKDLFFYPSDPSFDELGSLEITGAFIDEVNQCVEMAWNIVKSRIRYKLDEYDLIPKILGTCNPSKNWVYKNFYKLSKINALTSNKKFIQSLVTDNPNISEHYIQNLKELPKAQRDRLLYGIWEIDDASALISYDNILNLFTNDFIEPTGKNYITADIARLGSDKAVIIYWEGFIIKEVYEYDLSLITTLQDTIKTLRRKYNVPLSRIIADVDGVGGGLVDNLGIIGFVNNSVALNKENYTNLKNQCLYKLAEKIEKNGVYCSAELTTEQQNSIIEELEQIKSDNTGKDDKLRTLSKVDIKQNIGRSPDYSDAIMMRMYFELVNQNSGRYSIGTN